MLERCEVYAAEVPDGVAVLTAGIDTRDGRFEIEVTGWGRNEESWSIAFDVIEGDLETNEPWQRLDAYLKQVWRRADGRGFTIMAACMDSGGHHTQKVYEFAKERLGRRIWAIRANRRAVVNVRRFGRRKSQRQVKGQFQTNHHWGECGQRYHPRATAYRSACTG